MALRNLQTQKGDTSGSYTPVIAEDTNVASSTVRGAFFSVNGALIECAVRIEVTATAAVPTATSLRFTLPFPVEFAATAFDLIGTVTADDDSVVADISLTSDSAGTQAQLDYSAVATTSVDFSITFAYLAE